MSIRLWIRIAGASLICMGIGCLPVGIGASPKRDTSSFSHLADSGASLRLGAILFAVGLAVFGASFIGSRGE